MPRKPADQVIEHRISLQDAERTLLLKPVNEILTDVQAFTEQANTMRQVATYGALGLGLTAVIYIPKVWSETMQLLSGTLSAANPLTMPERFVDWWEDRGVPTGIIGDFIKNRPFGS